MRILVLEQHRTAAAVLRNGLQQQGYNVAVAHNIMELRSLTRARTFDAMVVDLVAIRDGAAAALNAVKVALSSVPALGFSPSGDDVPNVGLAGLTRLDQPFHFEAVLNWLKDLRKGKKAPPTDSSTT